MEQLRIEILEKNQEIELEILRSEILQKTSLVVTKCEKYSFYKVEGENIVNDSFKKRCKEVFCDEIIQEIYFSDSLNGGDSSLSAALVEVSFRSGVTDNAALSAQDAFHLFQSNVRVSSGTMYLFHGDLEKNKVQEMAIELLGNPLIQEIKIYDQNEFQRPLRFKNIILPKVILHDDLAVLDMPLDKMSDNELLTLAQERCLALTLGEMKFIQKSFSDLFSKESERKRSGLPDGPTDLELEVIAQSWSEHCKHKIFSANISFKSTAIGIGMGKEMSDGEVKEQKISGLYATYIKKSTNDIKKKRNLTWLKSVFSDNAGIVRFDDKVDLCIKVETHNSPSALDPYGGALTGILGVNRDILGCGMGAKPIANTDVFCLGPIDETLARFPEKNPQGLKHPRNILKGVHKGVEDGGNKSGIPTINGALFHHLDYSGKPLIFCGTVGVLPREVQKYDGELKKMKAIPSSEKSCSDGDYIVMVGGAIGADGIHGATFSSLELDENSPSTAVQIGDPLTQKRMTDFLLEARDLGLYSCITDNGAGGLSSSVGEMATITNGATIDLAKCPVKYPGLRPYELMISESQERMTVAVAKEMWPKFKGLADDRNVSASHIGEFNESGLLTVFYGGEIAGRLDLKWLHDALPPMELNARWDEKEGASRRPWYPLTEKLKIERGGNIDPEFFEKIFSDLLKSPNIASKENLVRQYDHEVQGATHIKPFVGPEGKGPSDSGVIWLAGHGGEKDNGVGVACGLAPRLSDIDPYLMAQFAVDEAVRNVVATGGDIDHCCLLDNFCWPDPVQTLKNPHGDRLLGQLVRTCQGLYDICTSYGTPLVSGKDSMKNDFKGKNIAGEEIKISVLPTLLVTAMAKTKVTETITSFFKEEGDSIYLLGDMGRGLLGSEFLELNEFKGDKDNPSLKLPPIDLPLNMNIYHTLKVAFSKNLINSLHDISDGGLAVAIFESALGGGKGVSLDVSLPESYENEKAEIFDLCELLFNEAPGRFILSVSEEKEDKFKALFKTLPFTKIGRVTSESYFNLKGKGKKIIAAKMSNLESHWRGKSHE